jgi:hypothetical protein
MRRQSYTINEADPDYEVIYLGNVLTTMAKGDVDKPLALIWKSYESHTRPDMPMTLCVTRAGLKATTKQQGLTEYYAHRTTYCVAHPAYPRVFCWVYKHEGKKMKPELRCHAVLCRRPNEPAILVDKLTDALKQALLEYKREKMTKQTTRLAGCGSGSLPRRKDVLITGTKNFRPPISVKSRTASALNAIDEDTEDELVSVITFLELGV